MRLDRDAALALEVHGVEHLIHGLLGVHRAGERQQPIGQRRFAVIDVGDDREIPDAGERHASQSSIAREPFGRRAGTTARASSDGAGAERPRRRRCGRGRRRSSREWSPWRRRRRAPTGPSSMWAPGPTLQPVADDGVSGPTRAAGGEATSRRSGTARPRWRRRRRAVPAGSQLPSRRSRPGGSAVSSRAREGDRPGPRGTRRGCRCRASRPGAPAEAGHAVGDERGEELALDRHRTIGRHALEQAGVEQIDAGVHGVGRDRLVRRRLFAEAPRMRPSAVGLDEPVLARVVDAREQDGRRASRARRGRDAWR